MSFNDRFNRYVTSNLPSKIEPDNTGGIFIMSEKDIDTIIHLDRDYKVVKELKIEGLRECANFEENPIDPKYQRVYSISYINNLLLISLTDNTTVVTDEEGKILNVLKTHKLSKNRVGGINYSIRCIFKKLSQGKILVLANSKFHGSFLAKSINNKVNFISDEMFETFYLNDTYRSPEQTMLPLLKMKNKKIGKSIGEIIQIKANNHLIDKNPDKEHIHYVSNMRIWDSVEIEGTFLLLFLYSNMVNKSNQPNKNMPYFFIKIDLNSGELIKIISPEDRAIFKQNLLPRFMVNDNRILFKTMNAIYEITSDLNLGVIYQIPNKSMFKRLFPISYDSKQIHFANPEKGELFSYSNKNRIEFEVENLLKSYRKQKKEYKNSMESSRE